MENYDIVNNNIMSNIREKLILNDLGHNMFADKKNSNESELLYNTIKNFINKF